MSSKKERAKEKRARRKRDREAEKELVIEVRAAIADWLSEDTNPRINVATHGQA